MSKAKTKAALAGSIIKWEAIVKGTGRDRGISDCPLCREFLRYTHNRPDCGGCPVAESTGMVMCADSPYTKWAILNKANKTYDTDNITLTPEGRLAAQAELDFLVSLKKNKKTTCGTGILMVIA